MMLRFVLVAGLAGAALAVEAGRIALRNDLKPSEPLRLEVTL